MRDNLLQLAESFLKSDSVQNADKEKKAPPLPPRPSATQLVYYQTSTSRMTNTQLCTFAIVTALGTLGITVTAVTVIKKIMSRILKSIANYQANRYKETNRLFEKIDESIIQTKTEDDGPLRDQQIKLKDSLDRLVQLARKVKQDREDPYEGLKSNIDGLRNAMLQQPLSSNQNTYGASAYINMYHDRGTQDAVVQSIKSEIRSVKGMLLSRRNFPVVIPSVSAAAATKHSVIPAPKDKSPSYHPRRKRSFRSELNPLTNPV
ncbi:hypothetical protein INT48_009405 [Thamnidium elegans]|uniref:Uncharacterized protein n=1 Tax=Thamnidium elegans TaxID=101142 RepID=A0A8H7VUN9_9FUNG|nr:hypothetical protein INT48_009405 [Thamnidium elegans]